MSTDPNDIDTPETPGAESKKRILIGSQRSDDNPVEEPPTLEAEPVAEEPAEPAIESTESPEPTHEEVVFPAPRVERISDQLQREIDDALGEMSLDELMGVDVTSTTGEELEAESRHQAKVVKIYREDVFVSLGGRNDGIVPLKYFPEPPEIGAMIDVAVVSFNAEDGLYELSVPGASVDVGDWSDVSEGVVVEAVVTGHNKGGLECDVNRLRGFIPASQISTVRVEDMEEFVGEKLQCVVTEANSERRNLVLSHRAIMERERADAKEKLMEELEVGQKREGIVSRIQDFGAFVDLGGVDGLVHISKLSWDRVNHPSDVLSEGQSVKVTIEKIDLATGKIGLSLRDSADHPWKNVDSQFHTGEVVAGTVSRIAQFGAFVRLAPGIEGLIHISEIAHQRVQSASTWLSDGQEIQVKILTIDSEAQRIGLSLKALQTAPGPKKKPDVADEEEPLRDLAVPKHDGPLKGGTNRPTGGEDIGLKW